MAVINFEEARDLATNSQAWMEQVSNFIADPANNPAPTNIYATQKLAFEIDLEELKEITANSEKLLGILGYESDGSLTVVLVGTDSTFKPSASVKPIETFPIRANMSELNTVLNVYLKP